MPERWGIASFTKPLHLASHLLAYRSVCSNHDHSKHPFRQPTERPTERTHTVYWPG